MREFRIRIGIEQIYTTYLDILMRHCCYIILMCFIYYTYLFHRIYCQFTMLRSFFSLCLSILEYKALLILLMKSSLARWHWWLLFYFSHFSTLVDCIFVRIRVCVCVCVRSVANDPLHFTILHASFPLSPTPLDFHSLIHLFHIHSIEYKEKA